MKAIETAHVGCRNCKPPTITPVPAGMDAHIFLALYLETWMSDGYKVVGSYGNRDTFGLCKIGGMLEAPVLRVRLVEVATVEARAVAS